MGMSASQMRNILLNAKKSNLEFEGQQINQQRTTLSNTSSSLQNQLLNLEVPTAPSSSQFTKTAYSFKSTDLTTQKIGSISLNSNGSTYNINTTYDTTEPTGVSGNIIVLKTSTGYKAGSSESTATPLELVTLTVPANASESEETEILADQANLATIFDSDYASDVVTPQSYSISLNGQNVTLSPVNLASLTDTQKTNMSSMFSDFNPANTNVQYYSYQSNGTTYYVSSTELANMTDNTKPVKPHYIDTTDNTAKTVSSDLTVTNHPAVNEQYYKYSQGGVTRYFKESELQALLTGTTTNANGTFYYVQEDANVTKTNTFENATIHWSDSGRMESFTVTDANGYEHTYELSVSTTTDDAAYNDAMNEYEYQKDVYNQSMNNINAKIDIIQEQDKSLELKLRSIDTEHQAVQTEIDAVKKVIEKNIEGSFKTFG